MMKAQQDPPTVKGPSTGAQDQVSLAAIRASRQIDERAYRKGVHPAFIGPGKPIANTRIGIFNGWLGDEPPNEHWFTTMAHACQAIGAWRIAYSTERSRKSLGNLQPEEFMATYRKPTGKTVSLTEDSNLSPQQIGVHVTMSHNEHGYYYGYRQGLHEQGIRILL